MKNSYKTANILLLFTDVKWPCFSSPCTILGRHPGWKFFLVIICIPLRLICNPIPRRVLFSYRADCRDCRENWSLLGNNLYLRNSPRASLISREDFEKKITRKHLASRDANYGKFFDVYWRESMGKVAFLWVFCRKYRDEM